MSDNGRASQRRAVLMSAALFGAGTLHFLAPKPYDSIVPPALPGRARTYTYASGVAELGVAAALAAPRTRRLGGKLAALLFIAVFPANVQMTVDSVRKSGTASPLTWVSVLRLPLQIPMIRQALRISREAA